MGIYRGCGYYETMEEAGYQIIRRVNREYHLLNLDTNKIEVFASNRYYSGWAIIYKNTHLEFCRSL